MKSILLLSVFLAACGGGGSDKPAADAQVDTAVHGHTQYTTCYPNGVESQCPVFIKDAS